MAIPSPSITITETDEINKIIYYKIEYGENKRFANTQANYYDYLAGKNSNSPGEPFVGYDYASGNKKEGSVSYQTAYDNYESSITISVQYQYYKVYLGETYNGWISYDNIPYDSQSKATEVMESLKYGTLGLYKVTQYSDLKYYIQIKNKPQYSNNNVASFPTTSIVTTTATFTKKPEPDPEPPAELPDFNCSVTAKTNSASARVSGIKPSDKVSFTINGTTETINVSNGSEVVITIDGLAEGTTYSWSVSVEGYKGPKTGTVVTLTTSYPSITIQSISYTTATAVINNLKSGDEIDFVVYLQDSNEVAKPSTTLYAQGSSVSIPISGLTEGTRYRAPAVINNQTSNFINANFETLKSNVSYSTNKGTNSMEVKVSGLGNGITATYWFKEGDGGAPESNSPSGATSYTWTNSNLKYNTTYTHSLRINYPDNGYRFLFLSETFSFTPPSELEPDYDIENITDTSAEINFINLKANDSIRVTLYDASDPVETKTATVQEGFSTMGFIFKNLEPNTYYTVSVQVNGKPLTSGGFTTSGSSGTDISYTLTDITYDGLTVNISNAPANVEVEIKIQYNGTISFYGTTNNNGNASITVSGLGVGLPYKAWIYVSESLINSGGDDFYTLFKWWISNPVKGNTMEMYNNSPAPVKAEEWNRLVALINSKLSKNINTVSAGDEMNAGSGGNVKVVASALGVSIESKAKVTASFFDALKNAINNIKG